jgi:hypothetical protein
MKITLRAFILITLSCLCLLTTGARRAVCQENNADQAPPEFVCPRPPFDSYGNIPWEDEEARLDNFAISLQNELQAKGYIMVYVGKDDLPGITTRLLERPPNYLVNLRGIDAERLTIINGGYREQRAIELWIVPADALPPAPSNTIEVSRLKDLPYKFDEASFETSEAEYEPAESQEAAEGDGQQQNPVEPQAEAATTATDELVQNNSDAGASSSDEETADPASEEEQAPQVPVKLDLYWCARCFAAALKAEAKTRGYLIYYYDGEDPNGNQVQEIVAREIEKFSQKYGIDAARLEPFYGGYSKSPLLELWIGPENRPRPISTIYPRQPGVDAGTESLSEKP